MSQNMFAGVEETIQKVRLKKPGIYKAKFLKSEFIEKEAEKDKKAYKCILLTFEIHTGEEVCEFEHRIFQPALKDEDRVPRDKYLKGIIVGKMSFEEQFEDDHRRVFINLAQLCMASGITFNTVKDALIKATEVVAPEKAFEAMGKYMESNYKDGFTPFIDIKIIVVNSKKQQKSQLSVADGGPTNLAYAIHNPNGKSKLSFTQYEETNCLKFLYTGTGNAPKGDDILNKEQAAPMNLDVDTEFSQTHNSAPDESVDDLF